MPWAPKEVPLAPEEILLSCFQRYKGLLGFGFSQFISNAKLHFKTQKLLGSQTHLRCVALRCVALRCVALRINILITASEIHVYIHGDYWSGDPVNLRDLTSCNKKGLFVEEADPFSF